MTQSLTAFQFRMPAGIPGDVNRTYAAIVETRIIDDSDAPDQYGVAVVVDDTTKQMRMATAGDVAGDLYGVLARPYPTNAGQSGLGTSVPPTEGPCDVMRSGYMSVKLYGATASALDGLVYVRIANAGAGQVVGGFEAAADGGNTILAPAKFMGPADAGGNTEIAWNI